MKSYSEKDPVQNKAPEKIARNILVVYAGAYPLTDINSQVSFRRDGYFKLGLADSGGPIVEVRRRVLTPFELESLPATIATHLKRLSEKPKYLLINGVFVEGDNLVRVGQINDGQFQTFTQSLEEILKKGR